MKLIHLRNVIFQRAHHLHIHLPLRRFLQDVCASRSLMERKHILSCELQANLHENHVNSFVSRAKWRVCDHIIEEFHGRVCEPSCRPIDLVASFFSLFRFFLLFFLFFLFFFFCCFCLLVLFSLDPLGFCLVAFRLLQQWNNKNNTNNTERREKREKREGREV